MKQSGDRVRLGNPVNLTYCDHQSVSRGRWRDGACVHLFMSADLLLFCLSERPTSLSRSLFLSLSFSLSSSSSLTPPVTQHKEEALLHSAAGAQRTSLFKLSPQSKCECYFLSSHHDDKLSLLVQPWPKVLALT